MKKLKISEQELKGYVNSICREILISDWRPDYIVGITRGGLVPAVMISQYLNVKMNSLDVSLRDGGDTVTNCGMAEDAYNGKNILVVDDINDTGSTINWIMLDWETSCLPGETQWKEVWNSNVRFATIVDNLASNCIINMDYVGLEINKKENDVWVDFPWEIWWTK